MKKELKNKISEFTKELQIKFAEETKHENKKYLLGVLTGVKTVLDMIQETADDGERERVIGDNETNAQPPAQIS